MFTSIDVAQPEPFCQYCHQRLTGDWEDVPGPPLGPLCGECYRSQQMDDEIAFSATVGHDDHDDGLDF